MKQLVQLQAQAEAFDALEVEIICVLREDDAGVEGAKRAQARTKIDQVLHDTPVTHTKAYPQDLFGTYFIDKKGTVKALLAGPKKHRPTTEQVLAKAKEVFR